MANCYAVLSLFEVNNSVYKCRSSLRRQGIKYDEKDWYLISYDTSTVTLLAKECVDASQYNSTGSFVEYSNNSTVKTAVDNYYTNNISTDAKTAVSGNAMFLLTTAYAFAFEGGEVPD